MARIGRGIAKNADSASAFGDGGTRARDVDDASDGARGTKIESQDDDLAGAFCVDSHTGDMADSAVGESWRGDLAEREFCAYVPRFDWLHGFWLGGCGSSGWSFGRPAPL